MKNDQKLLRTYESIGPTGYGYMSHLYRSNKFGADLGTRPTKNEPEFR